MVFTGRAEVVEVDGGYYESHSFKSWAELSAFKSASGITSDDDRLLYTGTQTIIIPTVIRTLYYDGVAHEKVKLSRRNIYLRDNYTCSYCGKKFSTESLNIDHIIPKSRGGITEWGNLTCSCRKCNTKKNDRTPEEAGMRLLRKPYIPRYNLLLNYESSYKRYFKTWGEFVTDVYFSSELID
jgi:5-methylcytosine-specific restriction endonuclease McrA